MAEDAEGGHFMFTWKYSIILRQGKDMAIKEVRYIPNDKSDRPYQRDIIRSDIKEALSKRIERFEFKEKK